MELLKPEIIQHLKVVPPSLTDEETRQINEAINRPWTEKEIINGRYVISISADRERIEHVVTCLRNAGWDVAFMTPHATMNALSVGVRPPPEMKFDSTSKST